MEPQNTPEEETNNTNTEAPESNTEPTAPAEVPQPVTTDEPTPTLGPNTVITPGGEAPQTPLPPPLAAAGKPKNKKKLTVLILLLVALLAGGGFAAYTLMKKSQEKTATAGQQSTDIAQLRIGTDQTPINSFYPSPDFLTGAAYAMNFQVYEGLVGYKNANTIVPLLAESWTNPDDTTWVFKIKENVQFHDGSIVTAEDVKRSIDDAINSEIPSLITGTIDTASVQDPTHVVIKTKSTDPILINKLVFVLITSEKKAFGQLLGTGAYKIAAEPQADGLNLKLTAFDGYHKGKPAVRSIEYKGYDGQESILAALEKGELDVTEATTAQSQKKEVAGFKLHEYASSNIDFIALNTEDTKSPLSKKEVRQAIRLLIDPEEAMKAQDVKGRVLSQFSLAENFGFNPKLEPVKQDVAAAKALLAKAGYPNGTTLRFTHRKMLAPSYEVYKTQLAQANITLTSEVIDDGGTFFDIVDSGKGQMFEYFITSALVDSYDLFAYNFQGVNYSNPEFDKLIDASNATLDVEKRKQILQDASKFLVDDAAAIPLYNEDRFFYVRDNINFVKSDIAGLGSVGYIFTLSAK